MSDKNPSDKTPSVKKPSPESAENEAAPDESDASGEGSKKKEPLDPTRYGDWEKNGRCIDF